ncbi:MFS transporter [Escherichia coli]|nr:MFS transporter [Escherichia coli]
MALQNEKNSRYLLRDWKPENPAFWENKGKHIARRNLWISVSCLLLAFCVWMLFSAVTVNLNKIGFNFTTDQLFLLTALPSVSGALLRVPYSFMVPIFGGRRWTVFSTAILIIPCVWLGIAVQNPNTPFGIFIVIALLCGFAGANFASSMGNISFFFPKAKQGSALGINGGLGNLGVSVMQLVAPLVIFVPVFAFLGVNGTGSGNFIAFYAVFMGLFLTAGLGSGSTFQMIAVIFRQITIYRVKMKGGSDEQAQREAVTETAAALGFISAIGAVGGFFIPQAFGMSLNMTGSPVGAMKVFLIFYIVCVLLTWLVYGRRKFSQK